MFRRDDIPKNDRFPSPITVTVRDVEDSKIDKRDSVVTVEDSVGHTVPLYIWTKHDLTLDWNIGHRYELSGVRGSCWEGLDQYELHTTKDFSARDCGPASTEGTRLLFVGDTHIGYENRAPGDKPRWAHNINSLGAFEDALALGESLEVDAVVHAGDIFDHKASDRDLERSHQTLVYERRGTLPFYYIYGNHDWKPAKDHMRNMDNQYSHIQRLTHEPASVGQPQVNLIGVDHLRTQFQDVSLESTLQTQVFPTILIIHESPHPANNGRTAGRYRKDGVNLESALRDSPIRPDLIVCGHMHLADQTHLDELDIPVIVTGPTIPISKVKKDTPSAWLATVSEDGLEIAQQPL